MSRADDSLYWACFHGSKDRIFEVVNQNNVKYVHPPTGDTPLHQACKQGWLDIVEMLIATYPGCEPNLLTKAYSIMLVDMVTLMLLSYSLKSMAVNPIC